MKNPPNMSLERPEVSRTFTPKFTQKGAFVLILIPDDKTKRLD